MSELEATAVSDFIFESGGRNRTWLTHGLRADSQRRCSQAEYAFGLRRSAASVSRRSSATSARSASALACTSARWQRFRSAHAV